jgi:hypothetical protein
MARSRLYSSYNSTQFPFFTPSLGELGLKEGSVSAEQRKISAIETREKNSFSMNFDPLYLFSQCELTTFLVLQE